MVNNILHGADKAAKQWVPSIRNNLDPFHAGGALLGFARFTLDFLDNVILCLWPILTALEAPPVNNVVDKLYFLTVVIFQEIKKQTRQTCP
tara:strand:- start:190 stop:462 length:273 start_codon:yes stop_codon:yes gene_type:complete